MCFLIEIQLPFLEQPATLHWQRLQWVVAWPLKRHYWHRDGKFFFLKSWKYLLLIIHIIFYVLYLFFVINCATIVFRIFMSPKFNQVLLSGEHWYPFAITKPHACAFLPEYSHHIPLYPSPATSRHLWEDMTGSTAVPLLWAPLETREIRLLKGWSNHAMSEVQ